jgi:hypothetical protein
MLPEDYLYTSSGWYCNGIVGSRTYEQGTVFGARLLHKYYAVFDRENAQVGFAESINCTGAYYILEYRTGNLQSGTHDKRLKHPFEIVVRRYNDSQPAPGIEVTWQVVSGDGHLVDVVSKYY